MFTRPLPSNSIARKYDRKYLAMLGFPLCAQYIRLPGLPPKKNLRSSIRFNENGLLHAHAYKQIQLLTKATKHSSSCTVTELQIPESLKRIVNLKDFDSWELVEPLISTEHSDDVVLIGYSCIGRNFDARHTETKLLFSHFEYR